MTSMTVPQVLVIEVLTASGCRHCQQAKTIVKEVLGELSNSSIKYREINVVEEIDYAVTLGVLKTPAIAFNGKVIFPILPTKTKLRQAIKKHLAVV